MTLVCQGYPFATSTRTSTMAKCGPHVHIEKTLYETVSKTHLSRNSCFQCFLGSNRSYNVRSVPAEDIDRTGDYLRNNDINFYTHSSYLINLARNDEIAEKGKSCLQKVLTILGAIDTERTGTVLHVGAKGSIEQVANNVNDLEIKSFLFFENCAGEGTKLGKNVDELNSLLESCDSYKTSLCIDTAHAFGSGMCDFRDENKINQLFDELPMERKIIWHLNDSRAAYQSLKDQHACVGQGLIWNYQRPETLNSLTEFYRLAIMYDTDIIFETPSPEAFEHIVFNSVLGS